MPDSVVPPADLAGWLSYLEQLYPKTIELGLERVSRVRANLGLHPDFPIITVTGTNGKGSTCALLEAMLHGAGYKVGCYTSPHLLRYNERVRIGTQEIGDEALCQAFAAVEQARAETPLTYFEFGTLAAVWLFARHGIDVAVLEVGLGGRLDAVNAFDADCAIVTGVDIDHTDYLGDNRESIGYEKAGIYRSQRPAICGDEHPPQSLLNHAVAIEAELLQIGRSFGFRLQQGGATWDFFGTAGDIRELPLPKLPGRFQLSNAACAIEALQTLGPIIKISENVVREALSGMKLAGRFQRLRVNPDLLVDVAHNPQAARGLFGNLQEAGCQGKTLAVFAMLSDKDVRGVVQAMGAGIDVWYLAGIQQTRGCPVDELEQHVHAILPQAEAYSHSTVMEALRHACRDAGENDRIIAFGSFYTVADVLQSCILQN